MKKLTIKLRGDLKQGDIELFDYAYHQFNFLVLRRSGAHFGHYVRAAIEAGWFVEPQCEVLSDSAGKKRYMFGGVEVKDLEPQICYTAGEMVDTVYGMATKTDPNLLSE